MPNTSIYIKEEDMPIFEEAKKLFGDNLSELIAKSVRKFVEIEKYKREGYKEFEVKQGYENNTNYSINRVAKFIGKLLLSYVDYYGSSSDQRDRGTEFNIYRTKGGKYVVYTIKFSAWQGENTYYDFEVFETLDEVYKNLPDFVVVRLKEKMGEEYAEWIE